MAAPGVAIPLLFEPDQNPDGAFAVRVFRNGVRADTVALSGSGSRWYGSFTPPSEWATEDRVQVIAYPHFGGLQYAAELWTGLLGGTPRAGGLMAAALILDVTPDADPTAVFGPASGDGSDDAAATVAAGATGQEFVVTAAIPGASPAGVYRCRAAATIAGQGFGTNLFDVYVDPDTPPPVSNPSEWSEPDAVVTAKRGSSSTRSAGTVYGAAGESKFFAVNFADMLEILNTENVTITNATVVCTGATITGDCSTNPADWNDQDAGTAVGAWFQNLTASATATWTVLLSDESRHVVTMGLVVGS